jgi:hypothetical protein
MGPSDKGQIVVLPITLYISSVVLILTLCSFVSTIPDHAVCMCMRERGQGGGEIECARINSMGGNTTKKYDDNERHL